MRRLGGALCALALALGACRGGGEIPVGAGITFPAKAAREGVDTITLEGATWGSGKTAVVFAHAYPATMDSWAAFARTISTRGFLALTFNFRGYGQSQGTRSPSLADLDLEAAVDKAKSLGATRIILAGASMGGTAALIVASRAPFDGVVVVSAPAEFRGLDASEAVRALKAPVLFLAADADPNGAADSARRLEAAAPEPKRLVIIKRSSAHGTELLEGDTEQRVGGEIAQFLIDRRG